MHSSSQPIPPVTPESIAAAKAAADLERLAVLEDALEVDAIKLGLVNVVERYGAASVLRWVRNAAHLCGQDI